MRMTMNEYQARIMRNCKTDFKKRADEALLGLIGETGEIVDVIKRHLFQSEPDAEFPRRQLAEEIGDALWYMAELANGLNYQMGDLSRLEFAEFNKKVRRSGRAKPEPQQIAVGASRCALQIYRAKRRAEWESLGVEYRRLLLILAQLAYMVGYRMEEIAQINIEKLKKRYPNGFDARKSMERYQ